MFTDAASGFAEQRVDCETRPFDSI